MEMIVCIDVHKERPESFLNPETNEMEDRMVPNERLVLQFSGMPNNHVQVEKDLDPKAYHNIIRYYQLKGIILL